MTKTQQFGVLARIELSDEGVKLVLEDMNGNGKAWTLDALFTAKTFPSEQFLNVNLPGGQLEDIGLAIVSRLAVFHEARHRRGGPSRTQ